MTDSDVSGTGGRLRLARGLSGLSARKLDRLAGGTVGYASAVEGGSCSPRTDLLTPYAELLGLSLDWLVRGIGRSPSARGVRAAVSAAHPGAYDEPSVQSVEISRKGSARSRRGSSAGAAR